MKSYKEEKKQYEKEHKDFVPYHRLTLEEQKKFKEEHIIEEMSEIDKAKNYFIDKEYAETLIIFDGDNNKENISKKNKKILVMADLWDENFEKMFEDSRKWW